MIVAHFIATNFVGGPERQILRHCERLQQAGDQVLLISFDEPGGLSFLNAGAQLATATLALPAGLLGLTSVMSLLRRFLQQQGASIVVAHGYKATILACMQQRTGPPAVAFSRGWTGENLKVRVYEWLDRRFIARLPKIVAVSHSQKHKLIASGTEPERIVVVHNAYLTDRMPAVAEARGGDDAVFLTAGRLSPEKGHRFLLEAFALVLEKRPDSRLLIAGDGMLAEALRAAVDAAELTEQVTFLGFVEDMDSLYQQASAFVLPSLSEGLPNVVLECFYWGLPVVATDVGGVPEIVTHERTGLLCEAANPRALADQMQAMVDDPAAATAYARAAQQTLIEQFGLAQQTRALRRVYQDVIAARHHED